MYQLYYNCFNWYMQTLSESATTKAGVKFGIAARGDFLRAVRSSFQKVFNNLTILNQYFYEAFSL